jgi:hypothetical protein
MQTVTIQSPAVNSEIAKASEQVETLTNNVAWYDRWKDRADVLSVVLLLAVFVVGYVGNRLGARLNRSNKSLIAAKEHLNKLEITKVKVDAANDLNQTTTAVRDEAIGAVREAKAELTAEQIKLKEEQRKTADAQRDAAEAQIALEKVLKERTEPRSLTTEQRTRLVKEFKAYVERHPDKYLVGMAGPAITVQYVIGNEESKQFALQFVELFREAGWTLWGVQGLPDFEMKAFSGLAVIENKPNRDLFKFLTQTLGEAGIPLTFAAGFGGSIAAGDVILVVGLRP